MARKGEITGTEALLEEPTLEAWLAQEPCTECGGRPGRNPASGLHLVVREGGKVVEGHTYNCLKRPRTL
jgi:hypothetical protein